MPLRSSYLLNKLEDCGVKSISLPHENHKSHGKLVVFVADTKVPQDSPITHKSELKKLKQRTEVKSYLGLNEGIF